MAKRKSLRADPCPVARAVDVLGDRWSFLIMRDVFDGMHRFGQLQKSLEIARNILSDRLQALVEDGLLSVQPASDGSLYQEYALTPKGEGLFVVLLGLRQWGERFLFAPGEPHSTLVERDGGRALALLAPSAADGRPLRPADTAVRKLLPPA